MSTLRSQFASQPAKSSGGPKINPEINARLDKFIAENPRPYDVLMKEEKAYLVRRIMLGYMRRDESTAASIKALQEVIESDPELKARVGAVLAKMPVEQRARAYRGVAQSAIADQVVAARRNGPRMSV